MEEIEVVINITKHEWEYLNKLVENGDQLGHYERLLVNGTPLPKWHGRLIDGNALQKEVSSWGMNDYEPSDFTYAIDQADTIIEADKKYEVEYEVEYEAEVITRGNCMMCGKELDEGLFFCKECEEKGESEVQE